MNKEKTEKHLNTSTDLSNTYLISFDSIPVQDQECVYLLRTSS